MGDLVKVPLGTIGAADLSFDAGALKFSVEAKVTVDELLTIIENAIPGDTDNKILDGLKAIIAKA